jgi:hypothetical protein
MATARSTDPEAVALTAELAGRGNVQDDYNPLGNYLLELWQVDPAPDAPARVERVFAGLGPEYRPFLPDPVGAGYFPRLDPAAARAELVELLATGLGYFEAFADRAAGEEFVGRLQAWLGPGAEYLSGRGRTVFRVPHWVDEGVAFASPARAGFLWCLGTD